LSKADIQRADNSDGDGEDILIPCSLHQMQKNNFYFKVLSFFRDDNWKKRPEGQQAHRQFIKVSGVRFLVSASNLLSLTPET